MKRIKTRDFQAKDLVIPIWKALLAVAVYFLVWLFLWLLSRIFRNNMLDTAVDVLLRLFYVVFMLSVITAYANQFKRLSSVRMISPALHALSSAIILYFLAYLFSALNKILKLDFIDTVSLLIVDNIILILASLLLVSYIFFIAEKSS